MAKKKYKIGDKSKISFGRVDTVANTALLNVFGDLEDKWFEQITEEKNEDGTYDVSIKIGNLELPFEPIINCYHNFYYEEVRSAALEMIRDKVSVTEEFEQIIQEAQRALRDKLSKELGITIPDDNDW